MQDNPNNPKRPLSEISHLFLSSLREQAGENRAKPVRIPPGGARPAEPVRAEPKLSEEEFANVFGQPEHDIEADTDANAAEPRKRVTAIVGAHLSGGLHEAVLAYAASLASNGQRIGVMALDTDEFKLQLVECDTDVPASEPEVSDLFDARQMNDVVLELNHDVDRWLLVVHDHRKPEARALIAHADDWTMLATCDHDGIVSGYRTLKGLAEAGKAPLSIALVDAPGDEQAGRAFIKLSSVCRQFLDWDVRHETLATDVEHAQAYTLLWCHSPRGKTTGGVTWKVAQAFLDLAPDADADRAHFGATANQSAVIDDADDELDSPSFDGAVANQPLSIPKLAQPMAAQSESVSQPTHPSANAPVIAPAMQRTESLAAETAPMSMPMTMPVNTSTPASIPFPTAPTMSVAGEGEVIELPDGVSVLSAVLKSGTQLLATPITPPMCAGATVAVGRDRGLVLVAQSGSGLAGMDAIAAAVRWLDDSKQLIAMAMPQLNIDAAAPTQVQLLIDHADRTAEGIRPLLGNSRITIRTYRRLRWAGRMGLLLDAA